MKRGTVMPKDFSQSPQVAARGRSARRPAGAAAALGLAAILWTPLAQAHSGGQDLADLVETVSPSVVTILATQATKVAERGAPQFGEGSPFEEFFKRFGPPGGRPEAPQGPGGVSFGSGFVISEDGYVVTNNHVIEDAAKVTVRMADEREYSATVVGADAQSDLALLKIDAAGLPHLALGDSEALRVGEDVIAVGNPFGLGGTVTRGIVSALSRDINSGPYVDYIQTDAAINRGNSGGPLLNMEGDVVGVNTAIYSPSGGSVGVGFAVPSSTVASVIAQLRDGGAVERGWLGVSIQKVTPEIAEALGLDAARGALVADVVKAGPSVGTLESGDVILGFDGKAVADSRDLPKLVGAAQPGKDVSIEILRKGEEITVSMALGRFGDATAALASEDEYEQSSEQLGAVVSALTATTRARYGLADDVTGVVVTDLEEGSQAASAGIRIGDVILSVNGKALASPSELASAVKAAPTSAVLMQVARGDRQLFIGVPLG